jgi:hypothetical protein
MVLTRHQRTTQNILESGAQNNIIISEYHRIRKNSNDMMNYDYESINLDEYNCIMCNKKYQKHNNFRCKICINNIIKDIINIFLIYNIILSFILCMFIFLFYYYEAI